MSDKFDELISKSYIAVAGTEATQLLLIFHWWWKLVEFSFSVQLWRPIVTHVNYPKKTNTIFTYKILKGLRILWITIKRDWIFLLTWVLQRLLLQSLTMWETVQCCTSCGQWRFQQMPKNDIFFIFKWQSL